MTERSVLRLKGDRADKAGALAGGGDRGLRQCGGNRVPLIHPVRTLADCCATALRQRRGAAWRAVARRRLAAAAAGRRKRSGRAAAAGARPRGWPCLPGGAGLAGWGYAPVTLGPRVLRAETAAIASAGRDRAGGRLKALRARRQPGSSLPADGLQAHAAAVAAEREHAVVDRGLHLHAAFGQAPSACAASVGGRQTCSLSSRLSLLSMPFHQISRRHGRRRERAPRRPGCRPWTKELVLGLANLDQSRLRPVKSVRCTSGSLTSDGPAPKASWPSPPQVSCSSRAR